MATEEGAAPPPDDTPELLVKLRERRVRHQQRNIFHRAGIVVLGVLVVLAGIVLSAPGVPGPGIVTILLGLGFLALEFDWAERWMARVIIWGDRAAARAERTGTRERVIAGTVAVLAAAAFLVAAILWDIPLVPIL